MLDEPIRHSYQSIRMPADSTLPVVSAGSGRADGRKDGTRFVASFFRLRLRHTVNHDAYTGCDFETPVLHHDRTNRDRQIQIATADHIAQCPTINATRPE